MRRVTSCLLLALLGPIACGHGPAPGPERAPTTCDALEPTVRALYQRQLRPDADPAAAALATELVEADIAMVLSDCRAEPGRVYPCVERAPDVAALERDCLIPLDDEGAVDGKRLAGATAAAQ